MVKSIIPKLPMRSKSVTNDFYTSLGFRVIADYDGYLMVQLDDSEIHFFEYKGLDPRENYGQIYIRTDDIDQLYEFMSSRELPIHPSGRLSTKPWRQKEFSMLDPDNNLLTFGQAE